MIFNALNPSANPKKVCNGIPDYARKFCTLTGRRVKLPVAWLRLRHSTAYTLGVS
jgi:hypothetical protein